MAEIRSCGDCAHVRMCEMNKYRQRAEFVAAQDAMSPTLNRIRGQSVDVRAILYTEIFGAHRAMIDAMEKVWATTCQEFLAK